MHVSYKKYSKLLAQHQGYLFTIISRRLFNKSDAEDVLQMCNEKILSRYDKFDASGVLEKDLIGRYKGWIAAFSKNCLSAWYRIKKKSSKEVVDDEVYFLASETIGEEDQEFVRAGDREKLEEINYKLFLHSRALNDYELEVFDKLKSGLNLREIGNNYGISHQAVQQLRDKIFQKVKRSFSATDSVLKVCEIPKHLSTLENLFKPKPKFPRGKDREDKINKIFKSKIIDKLLKEGWSLDKISSHFSLSDKVIQKYMKDNNLLSSYQIKTQKVMVKEKGYFRLLVSGGEILLDNKFYDFVDKFKGFIRTRSKSDQSSICVDLNKKGFSKLNSYLKRKFNLDLSIFKSRGIKTKSLMQLIYEMEKGKLLQRGQKVLLKNKSNSKVLDFRLSNIKYYPRKKNWSKYYGVTHLKNNKGWRVIFTNKRKRYEFGPFACEKEAAKKYNKEVIAVKGLEKAKPFLNDIK